LQEAGLCTQRHTLEGKRVHTHL